MKKLIRLLAVVAVMSVIGCGGAKDVDKKDEQKTAVRPDGTYAVTSYSCDNGPDILAALGKTGSMTLSFAGEVVTLQKMTVTEFMVSTESVQTTYSMNASITDTAIQVKEVKSKVITNNPAKRISNRDDGAARDEAQFANFSAAYSLSDKALTLTIERDPYCGDTASKVTANKQ